MYIKINSTNSHNFIEIIDIILIKEEANPSLVSYNKTK